MFFFLLSVLSSETQSRVMLFYFRIENQTSILLFGIWHICDLTTGRGHTHTHQKVTEIIIIIINEERRKKENTSSSLWNEEENTGDKHSFSGTEPVLEYQNFVGFIAAPPFTTVHLWVLYSSTIHMHTHACTVASPKYRAVAICLHHIYLFL